jgi:hypothetical protein
MALFALGQWKPYITSLQFGSPRSQRCLLEPVCSMVHQEVPQAPNAGTNQSGHKVTVCLAETSTALLHAVYHTVATARQPVYNFTRLVANAVVDATHESHDEGCRPDAHSVIWDQTVEREGSTRVNSMKL